MVFIFLLRCRSLLQARRYRSISTSVRRASLGNTSVPGCFSATTVRSQSDIGLINYTGGLVTTFGEPLWVMVTVEGQKPAFGFGPGFHGPVRIPTAGSSHSHSTQDGTAFSFHPDFRQALEAEADHDG